MINLSPEEFLRMLFLSNTVNFNESLKNYTKFCFSTANFFIKYYICQVKRNNIVFIWNYIYQSANLKILHSDIRSFKREYTKIHQI